MVLCRSENVIWIEYKFWIVNIMDFGETKFHWFSMNAAVYLPTHCFNLFCLFCLSFYYLLSLHSHLELDYSTEKCFMLKFKLILVYHSDFARWLWVSGSNVKFIDTHSERRLLSTVCVSTQYIYIDMCERRRKTITRQPISSLLLFENDLLGILGSTRRTL